MSEEEVAVDAVCAELKLNFPILGDESTFRIIFVVSPFLMVIESLSVVT